MVRKMHHYGCENFTAHKLACIYEAAVDAEYDELEIRASTEGKNSA